MHVFEAVDGVPNAHDNGAWALCTVTKSRTTVNGDAATANFMTGGCDGILRTWKLPDGNTDTNATSNQTSTMLPVNKFRQHVLPVVDVSISRAREGGDIAVSTSLDGVLKVWPIQSDDKDKDDIEEIKSITQPNVSDAWCTSVTRTGGHALVGGAHGVVQYIDLNLGLPDRTMSVTGVEGRKDGPMVMSTSLSDDDAYVVAGCSDGAVVLLDVETGKVVATWKGAAASVRSVSHLSGDGKSVVLARDDGIVSIADISSPDVDAVAAFKAHDGMAFAAAASLSGKYIASGGSDAKVRVFDRAEQRPVFTGDCRHSQAVWAVAWAPRDSHVVSVGDDGMIGMVACRGSE